MRYYPALFRRRADARRVARHWRWALVAVVVGGVLLGLQFDW